MSDPGEKPQISSIQAGAPQDGAGYHVVIADNDPELLALLQAALEHYGFRVSAIGDGKEAWDVIFKGLPDLVILDRMMPGMDGLSVVKNMRAEPETMDIPVLVLSARKEERDIKIGLEHGATDYMTKPCMPDDLVNRCFALLRQKDSAEKSGL